MSAATVARLRSSTIRRRNAFIYVKLKRGPRQAMWTTDMSRKIQHISRLLLKSKAAAVIMEGSALALC